MNAKCLLNQTATSLIALSRHHRGHQSETYVSPKSGFSILDGSRDDSHVHVTAQLHVNRTKPGRHHSSRCKITRLSRKKCSRNIFFAKICFREKILFAKKNSENNFSRIYFFAKKTFAKRFVHERLCSAIFFFANNMFADIFFREQICRETDFSLKYFFAKRCFA